MINALSKRQRGRPRIFDKKTALETVLKLFRKNGYDNTSLEDLSFALSLKKPSLYSAFGNKEQLFLTALGTYINESVSYFNGVFSEKSTKDLVRKLLLNSIVQDDTVFYAMTALQVINTRTELLPVTELADEASLDKYLFVRDAYLKHRDSLVYDGKPPSVDDEFQD